MVKTKVTVKLPKFKIDTEIGLNEILQSGSWIYILKAFYSFFFIIFHQRGMKIMFAHNANFSELLFNSDGIKISKVIHKASIEVNELGTEAAAGSGM